MDRNCRNRIIIKIGSDLIFNESRGICYKSVDYLARAISDIKSKGNEVLLVVSGAVRLGFEHLKLAEDKRSIKRYKQAAFSIGQCELINVLSKTFGECGIPVAQILVSKGVFDIPQSNKNIEETLETLFELRVLPIVDENSTVCTAELDIGGDNDIIAANVSSKLCADLLVLLTRYDGVLSEAADGASNPKVIPVIEKFRIPKNARCTGLEPALEAAKIAYDAGIDVLIMNGTKKEDLYRFADGKDVGTLFRSEGKTL